jgi:general secretion pathway protein G
MEKLANSMKNSSRKFSFQSGFTLIEIIIVIGILGILATSLMVIINPIEQIKKSNDAQRKSDLAQIQRGLELYYQDHGQYPQSSSDYKIINQVDTNSSTIAWGTPWKPYMNILPTDPKKSQSYVYYSTANGQTYYLYASLERGQYDTQACNKGDACTSLGAAGGPSANACGSLCNYGLSSPNVTP